MPSNELMQKPKPGLTQPDNGTLADISDIHIDTSLSKEKRIREYVKALGNPYSFLSGGTGVELEFTQNGKSLEDILAGYFIRKRRG